MKYVIVGGVAGGATAAARIRRISEEAEIVLLEKGEHISYANCGLPYYIGGVIAEREKLFVQTPEAFGRRFRIDVRVRSEVTAVRPADRIVEVRAADGRVYEERYDRLLLSPGASPVRPPLPGIGNEGIFTLRNVEDTDRIKAWMTDRRVERAVIVGAGFIGLEMAENLHAAGVEVSVVEMADQVMTPIDYSMAALVHGHLRQKGVKLYLERAVESFERTETGLQVAFRSGEKIGADLVLLSIGVRPNTGLAEAAGLELGEMRGIRVNDYLQTSDEHIYAVGDAIEFRHPVTGRPWLNYLAGPANRQARIAADNMVFGNRTRYEGAAGTSVAKVFDLTVATTGLPAKRLKQAGIDFLSATIHPMSHAGYYPDARPMSIKVVFDARDGRLYGAQIVGYDGVDKRIDLFSQTLKRGGTVYDLMAVEQAYAPPFSSAKDPVAVAGYVAGNLLEGKMRPLYWRELRDADRSRITLVDVRTPDEFALGALEGAVNIPLDDLRERMDEIPRDKPVFLYCGVGLRGYLASCILTRRGYVDVRNLIGGLKTYSAAVAPVTPEGGGTPRPCERREAERKAVRTVRVDACGLQCPGPVLKLKRTLEELAAGERLEIVSTDAGFPRDAEAWCRMTGNRWIASDAEAGKYRVVVEKGAGECPAPATEAEKGKTFILFSDDLDKALAAFVLANGAAATGRRVTMFFTFWGLNVLRRKRKPGIRKDWFGRMFDRMLPADSSKLGLSKMNMGGLGRRMMRFRMAKKGVDSLESLREQALRNGVEFIACGMSMEVMGISREELLDGVTVGGVGTYMDRADRANVNLFI